MRGLITTALILGFLLGFLASYANTQVMEFPMATTGMVSLAPFDNSTVCSPPDHIRPEQIYIQKDRVVIDLNGTRWAGFADTGSMLPVLSVHANSLEIRPQSTGQIQPCDIISYRSPDGLIVHRVVETGWDERGWYARTRGDASPVPDPHLVRFQDITGIVVGILY